MQHDDKEAIERVLAGDADAFSGLVERYGDRLIGLLMHACGNRELAEEIAQETLARAYRKLNLFSGESQFYTWLARIGMNLMASDRRRKRIENQVEREGIDVAMDSTESGQRPDEAVELTETQERVRQGIAMLDLERRQVLLMRDFDGLEYGAIAEALDIPVGTVRSRLHRARLELKSILKQTAVELGFF
ncbi:MAG: RNA polymerase sigma factor [Pirellulaceae bacterium]